MSKYRFKTIEEFQSDDLWTNDSCSRYDDGYPNGWCEEGGMNKYMGQDVPDTYNSQMERNKSFRMDSWVFEPDDYILKEEEIVDITEVIEQVKQINQNSLITKKTKMRKAAKITVENTTQKFVFMDKTINILNVGLATSKNVVLYGPGE